MEFKLPTSTSNLGVRIHGVNIAETFSDSDLVKIREQWVNFGVAIFPNQNLTLEEYENFSQLFGPYGQEPFLIPMQEHPHIVKLHRKQIGRAHV